MNSKNIASSSDKLVVAVVRLDAAAVENLLALGADPNSRQVNGLLGEASTVGHTALMLACRTLNNDGERIRRALLQAGADPYCKGDDGKTAFDILQETEEALGLWEKPKPPGLAEQLAKFYANMGFPEGGGM